MERACLEIWRDRCWRRNHELLALLSSEIWVCRARVSLRVGLARGEGDHRRLVDVAPQWLNSCGHLDVGQLAQELVQNPRTRSALARRIPELPVQT